MTKLRDKLFEEDIADHLVDAPRVGSAGSMPKMKLEAEARQDLLDLPSCAVGRDDVREPPSTFLGYPLLSAEIDVDQAKTRLVVVPLSPFEVIEQRPHKVAIQPRSRGYCLRGRSKVEIKIFRPSGVTNYTFVVRTVDVGGPVLRYVNGRDSVLVRQSTQ